MNKTREQLRAEFEKYANEVRDVQRSYLTVDKIADWWLSHLPLESQREERTAQRDRDEIYNEETDGWHKEHLILEVLLDIRDNLSYLENTEEKDEFEIRDWIVCANCNSPLTKENNYQCKKCKVPPSPVEWERRFEDELCDRNHTGLMLAEEQKMLVKDFIRDILSSEESRIVEVVKEYVKENREKIERLDRYVLDNLLSALEDTTL